MTDFPSTPEALSHRVLLAEVPFLLNVTLVVALPLPEEPADIVLAVVVHAVVTMVIFVLAERLDHVTVKLAVVALANNEPPSGVTEILPAGISLPACL